MSWFKRENGEYPSPAGTGGGGTGADANGASGPRACAPKACGSSAPAAASPSTRPISRPTATSAPSASITSSSARAQRIDDSARAGLRTGRHGGLRSTDPLELHRREAVQAAAAQGAGADRPRRRDAQCRRPAGTARSRAQRHGVRVHRRLDGRRGGRDHCPRRRSRARRAQAAHRGCCFRRRAHDGRRREPDADGEDLHRAGAARRRARALHLACSPIPRPAASPRASPCWAI